MRVKGSKDQISGKQLKPIELTTYKGLVRIIVPSIWGGWNSVDLTRKEVRRLASALLKFDKTLE